MSRKDKKQRREAKRKAKKQLARRQASISPVKRLAEAPGETEYWISDNIEMMGQMQAFVWKRAAGLTGIAAFLIDRGVVGLKDAWTRMDILHDEFLDMMDRCMDRGIAMRRSNADEIRRWVAGALRWTDENGMRLPKDWPKAAAFFGGVGDWETADVSAFVKEFAGHPNDLRQRLIGDTLENYLRRKDITFVFNEDVTYMDQRTGEYVNQDDEWDEFDEEDEDDEGIDPESLLDGLPDDLIERLSDQLSAPAVALTAEARVWLDARAEQPSPELLEAWRSLLIATMLAATANPDAEKREGAKLMFDLVASLSGQIDESRREEFDDAMEQAIDFLTAHPKAMEQTLARLAPSAGPDET